MLAKMAEVDWDQQIQKRKKERDGVGERRVTKFGCGIYSLCCSLQFVFFDSC